MSIKIKESFKWLIFSFVIALCAIFSYATIFTNEEIIAKGGIYVEDGGQVNMSGGNLVNNDQAITLDGGEHFIEGVNVYGSTNGAINLINGAKLTIRNSTFNNNTNVNGGAIFVGEDSYLLIDNCSFINNVGENGGAVYASAGAIVDVIGSTVFKSNSAKFATTFKSSPRRYFRPSRYRMMSALSVT